MLELEFYGSAELLSTLLYSVAAGHLYPIGNIVQFVTKSDKEAERKREHGFHCSYTR